MFIDFHSTTGIHSALVAMRLPHRSQEKSDSTIYLELGRKDFELAMKLIKAGPDHRKFLRLIDAHFKIEAPLYWWKQFDTYRIGVEKVSDSTMHNLMKEPIEYDDFEDCTALMWRNDSFENLLETINQQREKGDFETVNALLPQSYLQTRIVKCSYEALHSMYHARKNHRLKEWNHFCEAIEDLPFSCLITEDPNGNGHPWTLNEPEKEASL